MNTLFSIRIFQILPLIFVQSLYAQSLDLFQETDSVQRNEEPARRNQRSREISTEPAFTLVGTSRFGDEFYASLLSKDGIQASVEWTPGKVVSIDGFRDYGVANIGPRTASIRMPSGENCVSNEEKGVKCNANIAVLTLSNGKPIERQQNSRNIEQTLSTNNPEDEVIINDEESEEESRLIPGTNVLRRNPFSGEIQTLPNLTQEEQAARDQRRAERAEQFRNFEIVRIPDDEIPEGMQRIRTPFGDSLEPLEE